MKIEKFEDIHAWQNSRILIKDIYTTFQGHQDYGFKNQILRATISVGNNIAEGFERQTNNELRQFLYIAKGSAAEVRSMLYSALDVGYIDESICNQLLAQVIIISKQLSNFIKSL